MPLWEYVNVAFAGADLSQFVCVAQHATDIVGFVCAFANEDFRDGASDDGQAPNCRYVWAQPCLLFMPR